MPDTKEGKKVTYKWKVFIPIGSWVNLAITGRMCVRIIVNEFGGTNILITADYGFLYTYSPLREEDKVDKKGFFDVDVVNSDAIKKESIRRCVEYGRRYAIMQKGVQPDYLMPVKFLGGNTEFEGFTPRESIRIKMSGGGMNSIS